MQVNRQHVSPQTLLESNQAVASRLGSNLQRHGSGAFVSHHEILGAITEEYQELVEAVRNNDVQAVTHELLDLASLATFCIASIAQADAPAPTTREKEA